uniref:Uncharacterized protein n=1 Tax=Oryza sativa subsp. japonica TaxID=39947 RepID=Q6ZBT1_ORYSJ|nr:hypothetical protein [Oryza sativa Japonica Group]BAD05236.1 hypothetical protein [Oryza sativa Japonica Group]
MRMRSGLFRTSDSVRSRPTGRQLSILGLAAAAPAGAEEKRLARHHLVSSSVQADGPTMGMVAAPRSRRRAAAAPTGAEEERRWLELKRSGRREWRIGGTTSRQWRSGGACGKRGEEEETDGAGIWQRERERERFGED